MKFEKEPKQIIVVTEDNPKSFESISNELMKRGYEPQGEPDTIKEYHLMRSPFFGHGPEVCVTFLWVFRLKDTDKYLSAYEMDKKEEEEKRVRQEEEKLLLRKEAENRIIISGQRSAAERAFRGREVKVKLKSGKVLEGIVDYEVRWNKGSVFSFRFRRKDNGRLHPDYFRSDQEGVEVNLEGIPEVDQSLLG